MFTQLYNSNSQSHDHAEDGVKFYSWGAGPGASAGIIALAVTSNGVTEYLQFCPKTMEGVANRSPMNLVRTREGDFIDSLENAILIEGLRRSPELYDKNKFFLLGDNEKLKMTEGIEPQVLELLKKRGQPCRIKILRGLDAASMLQMIKVYKLIKPKFASLSGLSIGDGRTENCASIILKVLDKGARDLYLVRHAELLKRQFLFTLFVAVVTPVFTGKIDPTILFAALLTFGALRFMTGVVEARESWDNLSDLLSAEGMQSLPLNSGICVYMILNSAYTLLSGFTAILGGDPAPLHTLVLPEDVVDHVNVLLGEELELRDLVQEHATRNTI